MKGKFITTQVLLACLSKPIAKKKDIHSELEETIAERKKIMEQLQRLYAQRKSPVFIWTDQKAA
jgi:hypothetical protein